MQLQDQLELATIFFYVRAAGLSLNPISHKIVLWEHKYKVDVW